MTVTMLTMSLSHILDTFENLVVNDDKKGEHDQVVGAHNQTVGHYEHPHVVHKPCCGLQK